MTASRLDLDAVESVIRVAEQNNERGSGPICEVARKMLAELRGVREKDRTLLATMVAQMMAESDYALEPVLDQTSTAHNHLRRYVRAARAILEEVTRAIREEVTRG